MLINKDDIPKTEIDSDEFTRAVATGGESQLYISKKLQDVTELNADFSQDQTITILTRGTWGTVHLIEHLLKLTGPAECWLTSWSVKEQAVRILMDLIDKKQLTQVHCLFDERIRVQCPQAHQLIRSQFVDVRLTKIHAKLVVLMNRDWGIAISSSANLTRNPRIEAYVVFTHRSVAQFFQETIQKEIDQANPFEA